MFESITFRVRHSRSEMYSGHGRLCVYVFVCLLVCPSPHSHTLLYGPGCDLGNGRGALELCNWADLQSVHWFRCYDDIHVLKLIALYTANAYSVEREMSSSACRPTLCMTG